MSTVRVVITSPLSPENVATIAATDPRLDVVYEHDLIPAPEYPSSHPLPEIADARAEERWVELLEKRGDPVRLRPAGPAPTGSRSGRACAGSRRRAPGSASSRGASG